MEFIPKTSWGGRAATRFTNFADKKGVQVHHFAIPRAEADHAKCAQQMRNVQKYHMDTKGWYDIAYNWCICNHGYAFEGRGWNRQSGAGGTTEANRYYIAICYMGDSDFDVPSQAALDKLAEAIREAKARGFTGEVKPHSAFKSTGCPGGMLRLAISNKWWEQATPPVTPDPVPPVGSTPILGDKVKSIRQMQVWLRGKGAAPRFIDVVPYYFEFGAMYGVRPEVAIVQAAKETAWGQFTGVVPPTHHNWCGLKTTNAAGDRPEDHAQFSSDHLGVAAHVQHLALYAGVQIHPDDVVDPRHFASVFGAAPTVEALGGKWAPSATYGTSIVTMGTEVL